MHLKFKEAGEKAKALLFENCVNAPLLERGYIIDVVSTTPLHISLGLGLQVLNTIQEEAINLDKHCNRHVIVVFTSRVTWFYPGFYTDLRWELLFFSLYFFILKSVLCFVID